MRRRVVEMMCVGEKESDREDVWGCMTMRFVKEVF